MTGKPTVTCTMTVSVDGYLAGPDDEPGRGLGRGGERLHYWVFGGPWTYEQEAAGEMRDEPDAVDREFLATYGGLPGAVICGRTTYESSGAWGGSNPFGVPLFVVTHRTEDQPDAGRRRVTGKEADQGKFRTPGLREVGLTAPYMHNGRFKTLTEVVQHYNFGGVTDQANDHRDEQLEVLYLVEDQVNDLVRFLSEGLTSPRHARMGKVEAPPEETLRFDFEKHLAPCIHFPGVK